MQKKHEDKPVVLHPMTFEEALKRMVSTPPVNPSVRKKRTKPTRKNAK